MILRGWSTIQFKKPGHNPRFCTTFCTKWIIMGLAQVYHTVTQWNSLPDLATGRGNLGNFLKGKERSLIIFLFVIQWSYCRCLLTLPFYLLKYRYATNSYFSLFSNVCTRTCSVTDSLSQIWDEACSRRKNPTALAKPVQFLASSKLKKIHV